MASTGPEFVGPPDPQPPAVAPTAAPVHRTLGSYSSGRYAAITANMVMNASSAPVNPRNISTGRAVCSRATMGNIQTAEAAHPSRHRGRRPWRSPRGSSR